MKKNHENKWIERYESEHKKCTKLSSEQITAETKIKEQEIHIDAVNNTIERIEKNFKGYLEKNKALSEKLYETENK